jgi:hypothetical protein
VLLLHELRDDLDDEILRQRVEMELHGMRHPHAAPVVVELDLERLVAAVDPAREQLLHARVLREGNVRPEVEQESVVVAEGRRMSAIVVALVVHDGADAFAAEPVRCAEAGHAGTEDDDVSH